MKNQVKDMLDKFSASAGKLRGVAGVSAVLSHEDASSAGAMEGMGVVGTVVDSATLAAGDLSVDGYQDKAGKLAAAFAIDPTAQYQRSQQVPVGAITASAVGVDDAVTLSTEAFDGESIASASKFSFGFNLMATKQSPVCELFFPTIVVDPNIAAASVVVQIEQLVENTLRTNYNGATDFKKKSLVKALTSSSSALAEDRNRLYPVLTATNNDVLLDARSRAAVLNGQDIVTAPIRFGKDVNLLALSQTATDLAKGVMDRTDALSSRVVVEKLTFDITDGTDTETFELNTKGFPFNNFTESKQDDSKDIELSFKSSAFTLSTNGKDVTGAASALLAAVGANHTIKAKFYITGSGNAEGGNVGLYQVNVELVEVLNASGNPVPTTDAAYVAAKVLIDSLTFTGADLEAYTTNSNNRNLGQIISISTLTQKYAIPVRSGVTVEKPTTQVGTDNDASALIGQVKLAGFKTTIAGIKTLTDFADYMRMAYEAGGSIAEQELSGAGRHYVVPYYRAIDLDLSDYVDSLKSSERDADIKGSLISVIKEAVLTMTKESNYGVVTTNANLGMNSKVTVGIATSDVIAGYLPSTFDLDGNTTVEVESTPLDDMSDRIIISYVVKDGKRNEEANPLNFGQMFWRPEVSYEAKRTINGRDTNVLTTNPSFIHVVNLPVLTEINVSNLDAVSGKVAQLARV